EMITESAPLRCRKLSNPDIFSSAGKTKLHRQLSQDDCKLRRGSLASSLSGKQLLPLSNSVHSGVGQTVWQPPGDTSNLVRMRNQSLGQSAPSLTAGLLCGLGSTEWNEKTAVLEVVGPWLRKEVHVGNLQEAWLAARRFGLVGEQLQAIPLSARERCRRRRFFPSPAEASAEQLRPLPARPRRAERSGSVLWRSCGLFVGLQHRRAVSGIVFR
ncbi:PREDICTED: uncharacterized protein LOC104378766, partial [Tauraco erythrolophus]|uniref:uncharacterized protein LOC104378766 n=1 Tax=Tauraco erythrolophus TaxID=121530 RepID=UPI00052325E4